MARLIAARDLDRWAGGLDARQRLPELLRRLVHATANGLTFCRFEGGDESQRPGWDGETKADGASSYVPAGEVFWELGTDEKVRTKLNDDFAAREAKASTTASFVLITPRDCQGKAAWVEEKRKLGLWKDVQVYDSSDLEQWLERAPAVEAWLAQSLGKKPAGIMDLSTHWDNISSSLKRPVPSEALLVAREGTAQSFTNWIDGKPRALSVAAESPQEVVDVLAAWALSLSEAERSNVFSRALIVDDAAAWLQLASSEVKLVLISGEQLALTQEQIAAAVRAGHHVLLPTTALSKHDHKLERLNKHKLPDVLRKHGFSEQESSALAQHSGGSFSIVKRRLAAAAGIKPPVWANGTEAAELAPLLLAGAWNDKSEGDQGVISKLSGRPYSDVQETLAKWRSVPDAPVRWSNGVWEFVSPQDAWALLGKAVTPRHLDLFEGAVKAVLGVDHPRYELPREERWLANIHGKASPFSGTLRTGLARALALLSTRGPQEQVADMIPLSRRADRAVRSILPSNASWQRWASLENLLSPLAEASPEVFLEAMDGGLRGTDPELPKLFLQSGDGFTGRAEHTGLLWALETLAWSSQYLSQVAIALAKLAEKDPGGNIANRPAASLRDVFLLWMPHTTASMEERLEVIKMLLERHPKVGWALVIKLWPENGGTVMTRATPEWQDWADGWKRGVTRGELSKANVALVELSFSAAEAVPERWIELVKHLKSLGPDLLETALSSLEKLAATSADAELRFKLWTELKEQIQRHTYFSDAKWAYPAPVVARLEGIAGKLVPSDPVSQAIPLFESGFFRVGRKAMSFKDQEALLLSTRAEAVGKVSMAGGSDAVFQLAKSVAEPWGVGVALADAAKEKFDPLIIPLMLVAEDKKLEGFARGYAARRLGGTGSEWLDGAVLKQWAPEQAATLLALASCEKRIWTIAEGLGEETSMYYWKQARVFFRGSAEDVTYAVEHLISAGRSAEAVEMLCLSADDGKSEGEPIATKKLIEVTRRALSGTLSENARLVQADSVRVLLERIQSRDDADEQELATLEWLLLPALDDSRKGPVTLHKLLSRDPAFFVQMLELHYRPHNRDKSKDKDAEPDENRKGQVTRAMELLHGWRLIPGTTAGGIDGKALVLWVKTAREKAEAVDRLIVCDITIGQMLAHAPGEGDGSWPCVPVRDLLELVDSEKMVHGFTNGIINKRGIVSRSLTEGGKQEQDLSVRYAGYAALVQTRWPRTATALRSIVAYYGEEAKRQDAETEAES